VDVLDNYHHYYMAHSRAACPSFLVLLFRFWNSFRLNVKRKLLILADWAPVARARHLFLADILFRPHLDDDFSTVRSNRLSLCWAVDRSARTIFQRLRRLSIVGDFTGSFFTLWPWRAPYRRSATFWCGGLTCRQESCEGFCA